MAVILGKLACEKAPSEVGKKNSASEWKSEHRDSASEASRRRTPSSPDRPRLVPLALCYTWLSRPEPNRTGSLLAGFRKMREIDGNERAH